MECTITVLSLVSWKPSLAGPFPLKYPLSFQEFVWFTLDFLILDVTTIHESLELRSFCRQPDWMNCDRLDYVHIYVTLAKYTYTSVLYNVILYNKTLAVSIIVHF